MNVRTPGALPRRRSFSADRREGDGRRVNARNFTGDVGAATNHDEEVNSCQRTKLWREPEKPSEKESPRARRPASSFVKRFITSEKADTVLDPLNRPSR